ncbi:MAG: threonine synthase [Pirellulaceae bacterium]|nr:threonine synthase [Pirellulaceae bacterium]
MDCFVTHLEAAIDGTVLPAGELQTVHQDRPLLVRYDLPAIAASVRPEQLRDRPPTIWRYRELLPIGGDQAVTLGEGCSPLLPCPRLGAEMGIQDLWIKDESQLPTGSFKSRGLAMAISMARRFGVRRVAIPSAGNAGGAAAAYAARAGIEAYVFMPEDTPVINQYECRLAGARAYLVNGLINDCGRIVQQGKPHMNWFDLSTMREPYRVEGKKTMGLELAEQFEWQLPDVILYPTGGGTGMIGMWKAFQELAEIGWLKSPRRPRMVAVQSDGCAPIVRAFEAGLRFAEPVDRPRTIASGIRVPAAIGDFLVLDVLRESGGRGVAVAEGRLAEWNRLAVSREGIPVCPEAAACVGALEMLLAEGWINPRERVVIFNTGAAQKYAEAIACDLPRLDIRAPIDWRSLA